MKGRVSGRERKREQVSSVLLSAGSFPQMAAMTGAVPSSHQESGYDVGSRGAGT